LGEYRVDGLHFAVAHFEQVEIVVAAWEDGEAYDDARLDVDHVLSRLLS
jgi:hypothetical protein